MILPDAHTVIKASGAGLIWKKALGDIFMADSRDGNASAGFADVGF